MRGQPELGVAIARGLVVARFDHTMGSRLGFTEPSFDVDRVLELLVAELPFRPSGQRKVLRAARLELHLISHDSAAAFYQEETRDHVRANLAALERLKPWNSFRDVLGHGHYNLNAVESEPWTHPDSG